ncbi:ATP-dependent peptidase [Lentinula raphanica]|uniref:ATP-dependent peptidase n=1 Tax=Lentinula raphanica TaxID=153919 RepID=A0AA38PLB7_9AGAR|nr:ATP-dependent peptidase [Lentinula raphanica]KAJ3977743.1 ATP-dependent peptidase [Lentinula raphanica]
MLPCLCSSLRASARPSLALRTTPASIYSWPRPLSTHPTGFHSQLSILRPPPPRIPLTLLTVRNFTLGSIFSRKPTLPSPTVVANITRLEAEANVYPHDVPKQMALFEALLDTKLKASYELIMNRWEKMCEFDPSSPLLHSDEAFRVYISCLVNTGQQAAVNSAIRRRDSLLSAHPLPASSKPPSADTTSDAPVLDGESATSVPAGSPATTTTTAAAAAKALSSQDIAQGVLSGTNDPAQQRPLKDASPPNPLALASGAAATAGGPIEVTIVERKASWVPRLIRFIVVVAVSSFFFLVILSVFFENSGLMKNAPQQAQFEPTPGQTVKFSDVHGVDEVKDELQDIVLFLKDPSMFASLGGKLPKGVLLTGAPGTGKTMLARAVAGEAGVPFFFASGSDFEEMFVGVGAKRVRELFAAARKKEPAIIFIDEIDAVGGKRNNRHQQYLKQTLNQLLTEMDGFKQSEGVIVIAATNVPETLDPALVRPGRFDRHIAVPLPDIRGRVQILQHHMKNVTTSSDVETMQLARGTAGFSGADLQNMVNQAAVRAAKEKATEVNLKHFEWAKDRILMGTERKSAYIDAKNKLATAYHEGGHALVALYTDGALPLHKVTCIPRGHALGYTSMLPENDRFSVNYQEFLAQIDVSLGGRVAEGLIYGENGITSGASSDIRNASSTARHMVKDYGFSKLGPIHYDDTVDLSPRRKDEIEEEVSKIIKASEDRVTHLLKSKVDELHLLAQALVEHETLDKDEVHRVIKGEPIRNITEVLEEELAKSLNS